MGKHPFSFLKPKFPSSTSVGISSENVNRAMANAVTAASTADEASPDTWISSGSDSANTLSVNKYKQIVTEARENHSSEAVDEWEWLDVDVIDTTFLDNNVHGLRHCFFNINREVVNDLRDIVTLRLPAAQRRNFLERREGNVFTYRAAPGELSSIFGF